MIQDIHGLFTMKGDNGKIALMEFIDEYPKDSEYFWQASSLIEYAAPMDLSIKDKNQKTLFMYAVKNKFLLYALIGRNLLPKARYDGNIENYFEDVLAVDNEGRNALMHAILNNHIESIITIFIYFERIKNNTIYMKSLNEIRADELCQKVNSTIKKILALKDKTNKTLLLHAIDKSILFAKYLLGGYINDISEGEIFKFDVNAKIKVYTDYLQGLSSERDKKTGKELEELEIKIEELKKEIDNLKIKINELKKQMDHLKQKIKNDIRRTQGYFTLDVISSYINEPDNEGKTPLIYAITKTDDVDFIKLLLEKGADINKFDNYGKTPLMYALEKGNEDIIYAILERKPRNLSKKDSSGKSIKDYIRQDASQELRNAIEESLETTGVRKRQIRSLTI